ncbi:hypothetical protein [Knoellia sp. p5-6-4]|uniref:hypothetical protein n=1 Tax=unclassified Knoellia TaxID=2618719 RepID=UPI0023D9B2E6|nr:hypothetical protein [Knoellia sp. p5-6-4]MDF2146756.1 hypothetical protein [Knoellia sp. p5-6-4]
MQKHFTIGVGLATLWGLALALGPAFTPDLYAWLRRDAAWWWLLPAFAVTGVLWWLISTWWDRRGSSEQMPAAPPATDHDQALFEELLHLFPMGTGVMGWLEVVFVGLHWRNKDVEPLFRFSAKYEHRFFDDEAVEAAFTDFKTACQRFTTWLIEEAGEEIQPESGEWGDILNRTKTHVVRGCTYADYLMVVRHGEGLAGDILRCRKELERVGRREGLRPPASVSAAQGNDSSSA